MHDIILDIVNILSLLFGITGLIISCISLKKIGKLDNKIKEVKLQGFEKNQLPIWNSAINDFISNNNIETIVPLKRALYAIKECDVFKDADIPIMAATIIEELNKQPQDINEVESKLLQLQAKLEKEEQLM